MNDGHRTLSSISKLARLKIQCVGPSFISLWEGEPVDKEVVHLEDTFDSEEDLSLTIFDVDDVQYLRRLDPKEWKNQDHYAVLGLKTVRYKATEEDIKKAYRMKVLRHHPDKRKALGEEIRPDDDYFTCITKAWEILGNPRCRRSYDSIDPEIDDSVPQTNENTKKNFYDVFGEAFERNARWSEKQPVPKLSGANASREDVDEFYSFWYNFESWREFSYLDELDEKDKSQPKEERRYLERQNKAVQVKLKKDEKARLRSLVDAAYYMDPRVQKFKKEDRDKKLALKQAKKDAVRARIEEEERKAQAEEEEARQVKVKHEAEVQAKRIALKAERDAQKKELRIQKTTLRKLVKANDYFASSERQMVNHMASLEKICESFHAEELYKLVCKINTDGRDAFLQAVDEVERRIEEEKQALVDASKRSSTLSGQTRSKCGSSPWTHEELTLLIKAVKVFPAGTNQRWEVVANFINQHHTGGSVVRTAKEVLSEAKDLQSSDFKQNILKITANKKAVHSFEKEKANLDINNAVSERFDSPAEHQGVSVSPWTAVEQQLLEQALKTYPANSPERWDKIAQCIPTRSKKDCMRRYKELVEMVKAKKAAQAAAAASVVGPK